MQTLWWLLDNESVPERCARVEYSRASVGNSDEDAQPQPLANAHFFRWRLNKMEPLFLSPCASTSPKTEFDLMPSYSSGKAGVRRQKACKQSHWSTVAKGNDRYLKAHFPVRRMTSTAIVKGKIQKCATKNELRRNTNRKTPCNIDPIRHASQLAVYLIETQTQTRGGNRNYLQVARNFYIVASLWELHN